MITTPRPTRQVVPRPTCEVVRRHLTPQEASRRVHDYSLGMRQRLGIATALIGEPEVLILDEPANGLDPAGIRWMRGLLRDYADRGGTVLLSSHLLHEIEVIADDLVVIGNGRIVAQGAKRTCSDPRVRAPDHRPHLRRPGTARDGVTSTHRRNGRAARPCRAAQVGDDRLRRRHTAHRAEARRRRRPGGDVPRAHRRDPARGHQRQPHEGALA